MIFFTSDHHFGHANVIKYCNRPFKDVIEMDRHMIDRWNAVVKPDDTVYYLGDFIFGSSQRKRDIAERLNGIKMLIKGNHDSGYKEGIHFSKIVDQLTINVAGQEVILNHYPYIGDHSEADRFESRRPKAKWGKQWLLHGHCHTAWKVRDRMINVGVDQWDFSPVGIAAIEEIMMGQNENK